MPRLDGSVASMQDYLITESNSAGGGDAFEEEGGPSDGTLIARSLTGKMKGSRNNEEEEEPMTTAAVRELRRLQKERVYSRTLIRIRFPDRVCIQGYFHPRHTVLDVYEWVRSSINLSSNDGELPDSKRLDFIKKADFFRLFELYTSPPRCVLDPYAQTSCEESDASMYPSSSSGSVGNIIRLYLFMKWYYILELFDIFYLKYPSF